MDLRTKIGHRISEARKALGLSLTELAAKSDGLSIGRISNWERGTRSPRAGEIKLLAELLNVSASYLLCLTDSPKKEQSGPQQIRVLLMEDITKANGDVSHLSSEDLITIDRGNKSSNNNLFASIINDNSMEPEFNKGDVIVINPELTPKPGDFVLIYLLEKKQTVLRKYREVQGYLFRLLPNNELWATIDIKKPNEVVMLGVVTEYRRFF